MPLLFDPRTTPELRAKAIELVGQNGAVRVGQRDQRGRVKIEFRPKIDGSGGPSYGTFGTNARFVLTIDSETGAGVKLVGDLSRDVGGSYTEVVILREPIESLPEDVLAFEAAVEAR